jgi:Domain of unknown function (DUF4189)
MVETPDGPQFWGSCLGQHSHARVMTGTWYGAVAKSSSSAAWRPAWREISLADARKHALSHCSQGRVKDCRVVISGVNNCMSLAVSSVNGAWGAATSELGRGDAISSATRWRRKNRGVNCAAEVTPCGRQAADSRPYQTVGPGVDISRWSAAALASVSPEVRKRIANPAAYTNGACR